MSTSRTGGGSGIAPRLPTITGLFASVVTLDDAENWCTPGDLAAAILLPAAVLAADSIITTVQIHCWIGSQIPGASIRAAIYTDDGGEPGDLLAVSSPIASEQMPNAPGAPVTWGFPQSQIPAGTYHVGLAITGSLPTNIHLDLGSTASSAAVSAHAAATSGPWTDNAAVTGRPAYSIQGWEP